LQTTNEGKGKDMTMERSSRQIHSRLPQAKGKDVVRQIEIHSKHIRARDRDANRVEGGSRKFLNPSPKIISTVKNDCTCLVDAVVALVPDTLKESVHNNITSMMAPQGDTSVATVNTVLTSHGMVLERDNCPYICDGGAPYNLLQLKECRLVVKLKLKDHADREIDHFVAWDGKVIHDHPCSVRVNDSSDRKKVNCKKIFWKLLLKTDFKKWQITNIYRLVTHSCKIGGQEVAKSAGKGVASCVIEEQDSALQSPIPPTRNSSSADGVEFLIVTPHGNSVQGDERKCKRTGNRRYRVRKRKKAHTEMGTP
jgi:hypothetical protein